MPIFLVASFTSFQVFSMSLKATKEESTLGAAAMILFEYLPAHKGTEALSERDIDKACGAYVAKQFPSAGIWGYCSKKIVTWNVKRTLRAVEACKKQVTRNHLPLQLQDYYFGHQPIPSKIIEPLDSFEHGVLAIGGTLEERDILKNFGLVSPNYCIVNAILEDGINYQADMTNREHMEKFTGFSVAIAHAIPVHVDALPQTLANISKSLEENGVFIALFLVSIKKAEAEQLLRNAGFQQVAIVETENDKLVFIATKYSQDTKHIGAWLISNEAKPFREYFELF